MLNEVHGMYVSLVVKSKNEQCPKKSSTKINLVPLDAEFSAEWYYSKSSVIHLGALILKFRICNVFRTNGLIGPSSCNICHPSLTIFLKFRICSTCQQIS